MKYISQAVVKVAFGAALTISLLDQQAVANPVPLTPGGLDVLAGDTAGIGGTQIAYEDMTLSQTSVTPAPAGTLQSWVYSGNGANPLGGLTFVYEIALNANSPTFVDAFASGNSWGALAMDVGYSALAGGINPYLVDRGTGAGIGTITWNFLLPVIEPGNYSVYLVVDTAANAYVNPYWDVQDGGTSEAHAFTASNQPPPTPSPDGGLTVALLGGALLGLGGLRRKFNC